VRVAGDLAVSFERLAQRDDHPGEVLDGVRVAFAHGYPGLIAGMAWVLASWVDAPWCCGTTIPAECRAPNVPRHDTNAITPARISVPERSSYVCQGLFSAVLADQ